MSNTPAITVEQTTSADFAEGAITVDYPSGIAEGDLMVLVLMYHQSDTMSTPSGWTDVSGSAVFAGGDVDVYPKVYKKVVSAGDVSAGSLSVDVDDTSGKLAYVCFRISGYNTTTSTEQVDSGDDTSTGVTRSHTVSITPSTSGSLLIVIAALESDETISNYTATGSPTFTEVFQHDRDGADQISVVYAQVNSTSEITTLGCTSSSSITRSQQLGFIVRTRVDSDATPTFVSSNQSLFSPAGRADTNGTISFVESDGHSVFSPEGDYTTPTVWTNEAEDSTTWTNET